MPFPSPFCARLAACSSLLLGLLGIARVAAQQEIHYRLVHSSQTAPEGGTYQPEVGSTVFAADGNVVFRSGSNYHNVLWHHYDHLLHEGMTAPQGQVLIDIESNFAGASALNGQGDIAFYGQRAFTPQGTGKTELFIRKSNGILWIAAHSMAAPGGGFFNFASAAEPRISNNGRFVAFHARLTTGPLKGLYLADTLSGSVALQSIALAGAPAPDGGKFADFPFTNKLAVSNGGDVIFGATTTLNPLTSLYRWNGAALSLVQGSTSSGTMVLNDAGTLAFASQNPSGIALNTALGTQMIVKDGDTAPRINGTLSTFSHAMLNQQGQVAFTSTVLRTDGSTEEGLFRWTPTGIRTIALKSDPLPGGGQFESVVVPGDYAIPAPDGSVYFRANTSTGHGIFRGWGTRYQDGTFLHSVVRIGDTPRSDTSGMGAPGDKVTGIGLDSGGDTPESDIGGMWEVGDKVTSIDLDSGGDRATAGQGAWNDKSQIVYRARTMRQDGAIFTGLYNYPHDYEPEIEVEQTGVMLLTSGASTVDYGPIPLGGKKMISFTVRNLGTGALGFGIELLGEDAGDFRLFADPQGVPGDPHAGYFWIVFEPQHEGAKRATLRLHNYDDDENPFDIALVGSVGGTQAPDIDVQVNGSDVSSSTSYSIHSTILGDAVTVPVRIVNSGNMPLNLGSVTLNGDHATDFRFLSKSQAKILEPGQDAFFQIRHIPSALGTRSAKLSITNNDPDEAPFVVTLRSDPVLSPTGEMAVELPGKKLLVSGDPGILLGSVFTDRSSQITFTLRNQGSQTLTGIVPTITGPHAADFSFVKVPAASILKGKTSPMVLRFAPKETGLRNATIEIASSDDNETPFLLNFSGIGLQPLAPEIVVRQPADTDLVDGSSSLSFGDVVTGSTSSMNITVGNLGNIELKGVSASVKGANAKEFKVTAKPFKTVGPGATTTFTIAFTPTSPGLRTTALRIASNDADERFFDIALSGTAVTAPLAATRRETSLAPRERMAAVLADASLSGVSAEAAAVPYGDGVANLLKYAFNMDLAAPDCRTMETGTGASGLPAITLRIDGEKKILRFEFVRRIGSGLLYEPQIAFESAAGPWQPLVADPAVSPIDGAWERVVVEQGIDGPQCFGRVEVSLP